MTNDVARNDPTLEQAAGSVVVPQTLRRAWDGVVPEPAEGQVWRAEWEGTAQLIVILSTSERLMVAPVSFDIGYADPESRPINESDSPFGVPITVWLGLRTSVSPSVLDRYAGDVAARARIALTPPLDDSSRKNTFDPISATDPIHVYRGLLEDTINTLAGVQWLPTGTGSLSEVLRPLLVDWIAQNLQTTPQRALRLWRGLAALTFSEAERLSPAIGLTPQELVSKNPNPPAALIACIERPIRRKNLRRLAAQRQISDTVAHQTAAYEAWALAARQTGGQTEIAWDGRLDMYFSAVIRDE